MSFFGSVSGFAFPLIDTIAFHPNNARLKDHSVRQEAAFLSPLFLSPRTEAAFLSPELAMLHWSRNRKPFKTLLLV